MRKQNKNIRKLKKHGRDVNYINIKSTAIKQGFKIVNKIIKQKIFYSRMNFITQLK